jgi:alpha-methylacyl-CoA racemase
MGAIGPAPLGAMYLADLGADVVRIDRVSGHASSKAIDETHELLNRGKRSIAINIKDSEGRALALRMIDRADVLIEGFRPGVMERLGLGPDVCLERNPRLIFARMTGWGQNGPLSQRAGHDINYIAVTGALHAIGPEGGPPSIPLNVLGDAAGGAAFLAIGVLAALVERARSGRGQVIDAAIVDGTAALMAHLCGFYDAGHWNETPGTNIADGGAPWYATYETSDGKHVAIGPIEAQFYGELIARLGLDPTTLPNQWDRDRWPALRAAFGRAFKQRTRDEWTMLLANTDACFAPVLSLKEAAAHPQLAARSTYIEAAGVMQPAPAPRFSRTPASLQRPPPRRGEHTREVLREIQMTDAEINALSSRSVIAG